MFGEDLSRVMLGVWNEILVDLQHVCAIDHRRQVLDLLPEDLTRFDRPFFRRQSRGPCQRWSLPLARANIEFFLAMKVQSSSILMKEQASVCGEFAGHDGC